MKKIKDYVTTTLLGGILIVLPIALLLSLLRLVTTWIAGAIEPLTSMIISATQASKLVADGVALSSILISCFIVGFLVRTRAGNWIYQWLDSQILSRIPIYSSLQEIFANFKSGNQPTRSRPVLFSWNKTDNFLLAYITDEYADGGYAIFIPTSPSPLNGFVIQTTQEYLQFLDVSTETMMKTVISCGVDSGKLMKKVVK